MRRCHISKPMISAKVPLDLFTSPVTLTMPPDSSAMLAHIVSQTRQNVEFLMAHNEISRDAGQDILAKLPTASDITARELSDQTRRMTIQPSLPPTSSYDPPPAQPSGPPVRRVPPTQPQPSLQRAKALWTYNENGSVCTFPPFLLIRH